MTIAFVSSQESTAAGVTVNSVTVNCATGTRTHGMIGVIVNVMSVVGGGGDVTGVTWNGTALSFAVETSDTEPYSEIWHLFDFGGGTHDVVVSFTGNGSTSGAATYQIIIFWVDSDATMELDDTNIGAFTTEDPASVDLVPTANGELLISGYASRDNNVATKGAAETLLQDYDAGGDVAGGSYAIQVTAATQGMDWDRAAAGISTIFNESAASYKEASAGGVVGPLIDGHLVKHGILQGRLVRA